MATSIRIRGQVQGVGFRPFVWQLAKQLGITGQVWNDDEGVMIQAWGDTPALEAFQRRVADQAPPLARIDAMECSPLGIASSPADFLIQPSRTEG